MLWLCLPDVHAAVMCTPAFPCYSCYFSVTNCRGSKIPANTSLRWVKFFYAHLKVQVLPSWSSWQVLRNSSISLETRPHLHSNILSCLRGNPITHLYLCRSSYPHSVQSSPLSDHPDTKMTLNFISPRPGYSLRNDCRIYCCYCSVWTGFGYSFEIPCQSCPLSSGFILKFIGISRAGSLHYNFG